MYLLSEFLKENPYKNIIQQTSFTDFSNTPISWVTVQEMPVDNFINENNLVLSTASGCLYDKVLFKELIISIKNSSAAALFLTFKDKSYKIDKEIISLSQSIKLPLFVIPWEIPFAEFSDFILKRIHKKEIENYTFTQDKLFESYFNNESFNSAANIISSFLNCPVQILNKVFSVKGENGDINEGMVYDETEIRLNKFLHGYLRIYKEPDNTTYYNKENVEKYLGLPLSLWFNKENVEDSLVIHLKNDFVWNLAKNNYESFEEMAQNGIKFGFDLYETYTCAAIKFVTEKDADTGEYSQKTAIMASEIGSIIHNEAKKKNLKVMFAEKGLLFIIYVKNPKLYTESIIFSYFADLEKRINSFMANGKVYYGISEINLNKSNFYELYKNANLALNYCLNSNGKINFLTFHDTSIFRIMSTLQENEEIRNMAENTLEKLKGNNKESSTDLTETLIEYIKSNGNVSLTARNLNLHRQSLLYRLEKIERLTGMKLNERNDLFLLEVFTRIFNEY